MSELTRKDKVTVGVTQQHLDDGDPGNPDSCALALALKGVFPRYPIVQNGCATGINNEDFETSEEVEDWVREYDEDDDDWIIKPCIVEVDFDEKRINMVQSSPKEEPPEWIVSFTIYQDASTTVKARTEAEAIEIAKEESDFTYGEADLDWDSGYAVEY